MKQIVNKIPEVMSFTTPTRLERNAIVGMIARTSDGTELKYILNPRENYVIFSNGTAFWNSYPTAKDAVETSLNDSRCSLFAFESLDDLAKWLKK